MKNARTTIFVCVSCSFRSTAMTTILKSRAGSWPPPSRIICEAQARADIDVRPVECLSVCKRPCTIAFTGQNKWTYLVGDVDAKTHAEEIAAVAQRFAASEDGIIPWKAAPLFFRKGVIARVPPETYRITEKAE